MRGPPLGKARADRRLGMARTPAPWLPPASMVTTAEVHGTVRVAAELCKGCELCVAACPPKVLGLSAAFNARGYPVVALVAEGCTGCGACAQVCPDAALTVFRTRRKPKAA